ncbi:MAG: hypothetical protein KY463_01595 [Actinobacteria bacterium]|nr:hypothetical protein [Actinomycetota bacterium]
MRARHALAVLLVALTFVGCGSEEDEVAGDGAPVSIADPPPGTEAEREVLVVGDSLAEEKADLLPAALPGWRVRIDARWGRPLAEGMRVLAAEPAPPAILAISLFTNDHPQDVGALEAAVRVTAARPGGCAVWATIAAPPFNGVSYDDANALLRRLARDPQLELELVDWAREVARDSSLMSDDEVHASPSGYRARARMYAEAIRACAERGSREEDGS